MVVTLGSQRSPNVCNRLSEPIALHHPILHATLLPFSLVPAFYPALQIRRERRVYSQVYSQDWRIMVRASRMHSSRMKSQQGIPEMVER